MTVANQIDQVLGKPMVFEFSKANAKNGLIRFLWLFFIVGKTKHFSKTSKAKKLLKKLQSDDFNMPGKFFAYIRKIDPLVFEELLLFAFEFRGYQVKRNKAYTGDGGCDGSVIIDGKTYAIQAKRYQKHINPAHVKALNDYVLTHRLDGGIFIHTGKTGMGSYRNLKNTWLISGSRLHKLLCA